MLANPSESTNTVSPALIISPLAQFLNVSSTLPCRPIPSVKKLARLASTSSTSQQLSNLWTQRQNQHWPLHHSLLITMQPEYASSPLWILSMQNSWTSLPTMPPVPSPFLIHPLATLSIFDQLPCWMSSNLPLQINCCVRCQAIMKNPTEFYAESCSFPPRPCLAYASISFLFGYSEGINSCITYPTLCTTIFLFFGINRDNCIQSCEQPFFYSLKEIVRLQRHRGDGVIIWDSLGRTSDSTRSHQEIGLERI